MRKATGHDRHSCWLRSARWRGTVATAATTVVTADRMLDVLAGKMVDKPAIVVVDGRIKAVLAQGAAAIPPDATRIDLPGQTLLPGLIDMHVHLAADARIDGYHSLDYTDSFWVAVGVANAKAMLEAGFTTVRNVGSANYADVGIKQAVEGGYVPGPRIVPATYALGATGGHCDETEGLPPSFAAVPPPRVADGPDGFRALVRKVHKYGAEVIKICATGGVLSRTDARRRAADELRRDQGRRRRGAPPGPEGGGARARPVGHQRLRCAPASTPSSTPASPTRSRSGSPRSTAPGSRWTSTTTTTSWPKARRTACSRSRSPRNAPSA